MALEVIEVEEGVCDRSMLGEGMSRRRSPLGSSRHGCSERFPHTYQQLSVRRFLLRFIGLVRLPCTIQFDIDAF